MAEVTLKKKQHRHIQMLATTIPKLQHFQEVYTAQGASTKRLACQQQMKSLDKAS